MRYYPTKRNQPTYGYFTLSPATVHTDLEVTMIGAVHYIWPEAVVALSNFHLCQAWYRKIQAFNLTRDYRDVKSLVGRWLRLVFALPTVSADSVRECFLTTLTDLMPNTTEANLFADYIYGTYLHQDCSYPPIMWADILCRNVKTTNACEASNPQTFSIQPPDLSPKCFQIHGSSQVSLWNKIEQVSNNELKGHYQIGKNTQVKKNKEHQWPRSTNMVKLASLDTSLKCQK